MKTFLRLLALLRPSGWRIAFAILLGIAMVASNISLLGMAAYLIAAAALEPLVIMLMIPMYVVRFMGVVRATSRYAERLVSHDVTFRLLAHLRLRVYEHLEPLVPAQVGALRSGDVLTRLISDVDELQHIYLRMVAPAAVALGIVVLTGLVFWLFSSLLAITVLVLLLVACVGIPLVVLLLSRGAGERQVAARADLNVRIVDGMQGMQDLLSSGRERDYADRIMALDATLAGMQRRMARVSGVQQGLHDLLMNLTMWIVLMLAIPLVSSHAINAVYLACLALIVLASFEIVQPVAQSFQMLGHALSAGKRLFEVIDTQPQIVDPVTPLPAPITQSPAPCALEFEHVSFAYTPEDGEVLHDISFQLRPGKSLAIVGPSGAGKSTIVGLSVRFWDATSGCIRLNGQPVQDYGLDDLRAFSSVVAQDTYLFNDSLRGNLLLARPDASDADLERVLMQVGLAELLSQLPNGLDTWIGEQGLRLSGGERQRLAIARALLKDAPLLILDEATAHLDPLTEHALLEALNGLMQRCSTLMITHRLVGMERIDEILVLADQQVVQRGSHAQLVQEDGLYRQMFEVQNDLLALV